MYDLFTPNQGYRFRAVFFFQPPPLIPPLANVPAVVPSTMDTAFRRISAFGAELSMQTYQEGGWNVGNHYFPTRVSQTPIVCERGVMAVTSLTTEFLNTMSTPNTNRVMNLLVTLENVHTIDNYSAGIPISTWMFTNVMPTRWQMGDFNAESNEVVMNHLEMVYRRVYWVGLKL